MAEKSASTKRVQVTGKVKHKAGPSASKAAEFQKDVEKMKEKYGEDYVKLSKADQPTRPKQGNVAGRKPVEDPQAGDQLQSGAEQFPVRLFPYDSYDNVVNLKRQVDEGQLGKKVLTTSDLKWLQRKTEAQNNALYKTFTSNIFDMTNPAEAQLLQNIAPEILEEKMAIIDARADLDERLALMYLRGYPKDQEDLKLMYGIKAGHVPLPKGTLWDPKSWDLPGTKEERLKRGFWTNVQVDQKLDYDPGAMNVLYGEKNGRSSVTQTWPALPQGWPIP